MTLLLLAAAGAQPAETPRAFIQRIYAGYVDDNYSPLRRMDRIFARPLVAAIREDERLAHGEVGYLDGDPLCDCQDWAKIGATIRSLAQPTKRSAVATVRLTYGTADPPHDLKLQLALTPAGWRVADVGSPDEPSLLHALEAANREARKHH
ncbi:MAG TPA: DUF3828 domain-containing protein [Sphingomicrobium sp.]